MQGQGQAHVDEAELVRKAQEGNAAALTALYERFFERIFRYASFKVGSPPEAEDITADVFVKMLEAIGSFRWHGHPFSSWLFRIAHNLVVDHFRKRERRKAVPLDSVAATASSSFDDPDDKLEAEMAMQGIRRAMDDLTDLQREVISLRFAAGLSVSETAHAMGKKENAVKALQHAALRSLRRGLNPTTPQPPGASVPIREWRVGDEWSV